MRIIAGFLAFLVTYTSTAQTEPSIYSTKQGKEVSVSDIVADFKKADVLFFGEEHDDSIGHIMELELFKAAHKELGEALVLSLEMFERDVQGILNEYLAGLISEKNFIKEARAWKNYSDYKPLIEYAKENKIPVVAANTPARYVNAVTRGGLEVLEKFNKAAVNNNFAPLPIDTATGRYYEKFLEIMGGHGVMPGMHIYQSQNLWDATMAYSIYSTLSTKRGRKVMHLNGRFHTDEKLGTLAQLQKMADREKRNIRILNISCFYDENYQKPEWSQYMNLGDYVIVTPKLKKDGDEK